MLKLFPNSTFSHTRQYFNSKFFWLVRITRDSGANSPVDDHNTENVAQAQVIVLHCGASFPRPRCVWTSHKYPRFFFAASAKSLTVPLTAHRVGIEVRLCSAGHNRLECSTGRIVPGGCLDVFLDKEQRNVHQKTATQCRQLRYAVQCSKRDSLDYSTLLTTGPALR